MRSTAKHAISVSYSRWSSGSYLAMTHLASVRINIDYKLSIQDSVDQRGIRLLPMRKMQPFHPRETLVPVHLEFQPAPFVGNAV